MHRFFVPTDWLEEDRVTIVGSLVHQIRNVLRLRSGDRIVVLDNSGWEREVEIARVGKEHISGQVVDKRLAAGEPRTKITLYQGVLKGKRFEFALQKGTELGIVEFVPLISDRCVIASLDDVDKKRERWQRIILEAAEQSRRGKFPRLCPAMLFRPACESARRGGLSLIPWEEAHDMEKTTSLRSVLQSAEQPPFSVNIFVGPEGGFTSDEVDLAQQYGLVSISLGPRILRAETAGLVATAAILYELGDLE
jgi:16S rRNA (uracil1498-N3)-methyltransferase